MATWTNIAENLDRHSGGTIYLRVKINKKTVRRSLQTSDLRTAKMKRADELAALQKTAIADGTPIRLISDALDQEEKSTLAKPRLKESTQHYYQQIFASLRLTLPLRCAAADWTQTQAKEWWKAYATKMSPSRANNGLAIVKRMGTTLVERSVRRDDPTRTLRRVQLNVVRLDDLPSTETFDILLLEIRGQNKRCSEESANMVAFLAYSGLRIAELQSLEWEHISGPWLTITGGSKGTKNGTIRQIPINERLKAVIDLIRPPEPTGEVFSLKSPRLALENACKRLQLRHMRVHDLRHWFATWCIESGVDIPTVSRWLGHKDGGALAMRTYGHLRDQHSLNSAEKLR